MRADLHIHTYYSDGSLSAAALVDQAARARLDYLAITDHDCIAAYEEARAYIESKKIPLQLLAGVEFTAMVDGTEQHIQGYFPGVPNPSVLTHLDRLQSERRERLRKAIENLQQVRVEVHFEDLPDVARAKSLTQLHLAFLLMEKGYAKTVGAARRTYLHPHILPAFTVTAREVIDIIHSSQGLAVWAHPEPDDFAEYFEALVAWGLDGLEIYNLRRQKRPSRGLKRAAKKHGLVTTLGSDWHGHTHPYDFESRLECDKILERFLDRLGL